MAGQAPKALAVLHKAAAAGDASSWLELGILFLAGKHVPRDLAKARDCFGRSAAGGNPTAYNLHLQFLGLGVGGAADWKAAVDLLRDLARTEPFAAEQMGLIEAMGLSDDGSMPASLSGRQLSVDPDVRAFDSLFSSAECRYLIERARPLLQASTVELPNTELSTDLPVELKDFVLDDSAVP